MVLRKDSHCHCQRPFEYRNLQMLDVFMFSKYRLSFSFKFLVDECRYSLKGFTLIVCKSC